MPNGTMTGTGTALDPYIVMDGYDFDALRNITTSSTNYAYIELGDDIDLSIYQNFSQISGAFYANIDGKNHWIAGINMNITTKGGIFTDLHVDEYVKNITIYATINISGQWLYNSGILSAYLTTHDNIILSKVECQGNIFLSTNSNFSVGGIFGECSCSNGSSLLVNECSYKGTIQASYTNVGSTTLYLGGIIGLIISPTRNASLTNVVTFNHCYSEANFIASSRFTIYIGGITNLYSTPSSTAVAPLDIKCCVADISTIFNYASNGAGDYYVGGILGLAGNYNGQITNIMKSISFMNMICNNNFSIGGLRYRGMISSGSNYNGVVIMESYSVMKFTGNIPLVVSSSYVGSLYGTNGTRINSFFDSELLIQTATTEERFSGTIDQTNGITTAQLKNQAYLEAANWQFV